METMSKSQAMSILKYLDAALGHTRKNDHPTFESSASWNIRMARERLLEIVVADVEVEPA